MPLRNAKLLLVLVMWMMQVGRPSAFAVSVRPLPSLGIRAFAKSGTLTLACKKTSRKSGSSKPKKYKTRGFGAAAPSPALQKTPSNKQALDSPLASAITTSSKQISDPAWSDDLTVHQLGAILKEVLELYRNTTTLPQEEVIRSLLATRLENLPLNRCSIAPSSISGAGQGLFASRDIAAGELITCYPGDAVLCWEDGDQRGDAQMYHGEHVATTEVNMLRYANEMHNYEVRASATIGVLGDPLLCGDPSYLGHMTNDGACPDLPDEGNSESKMDVLQGDKDKYETVSKARANAEHISLQGCHMVTRATKPIPAGDEVFVTYGYGFWLSCNQASINIE